MLIRPMLCHDQRIVTMLPALRQSLQDYFAPVLQQKLSVDDIVQETFIRASKGFNSASFEDDQQLLAWMRQIANRVAISLIRGQASKIAFCSISYSNLANELLDSCDITASGLITADENREILGVCVSELSEVHRKVLHLRYFEQQSFEEIARLLGLSASATRGLHRNAIASLRRAFGEASTYLSSR
jgi:RNA polymerase sigma-70 factor, ECF subfamily